jgi:hypothetical protein
MALHTSVLKQLFGDTRSDVSDDSDKESLESDSDSPQLPYFPAHKTHREFFLEILEKRKKMNVF